MIPLKYMTDRDLAVFQTVPVTMGIDDSPVFRNVVVSILRCYHYHRW